MFAGGIRFQPRKGPPPAAVFVRAPQESAPWPLLNPSVVRSQARFPAGPGQKRRNAKRWPLSRLEANAARKHPVDPVILSSFEILRGLCVFEVCLDFAVTVYLDIWMHFLPWRVSVVV